MPETRARDRDSSRRDRKAPGNVFQRTPQPRPRHDALAAKLSRTRLSASRSCAVRSPDGDAVRHSRVELPGDAFDAIGRGIECGDHRRLRRLARSEDSTRASCNAASSSSRRRMRLSAPRQVRRQPSAPPSPSDAYRRSRRSWRAIARCAARRSCERLTVLLLPVLASQAELPGIDGDVHFRHQDPQLTLIRVSVHQRSWASSTARMPSIAASMRRAISRLVSSILRERAVAHPARQQGANGRRRARAAAAPSDCSSRSASRRRSTAASSASSASARRLVAASIAAVSAMGETPGCRLSRGFLVEFVASASVRRESYVPPYPWRQCTRADLRAVFSSRLCMAR